MRIRFIRLGNNDRPWALWEGALLAFVLPFLLVLLLVGALIVPIFVVACFLGWTLLSPVLPRSWRFWNQEIGLDPSIDAECPACKAQLALGPMGEQVHIDPGTKSKIVMPAQNATCPQCRRMFRRCGLGKIWSRWQESLTAEYPNPAEQK